MAKEETKCFIANEDKREITNIKMTTSHFLDAYSKGKWNLSNVRCPPCFIDKPILFKPPYSYNEFKRCKIVEKYKDLSHWKEHDIFKSQLLKIKRHLSTSGIYISIIDQSKTWIKFETSLNMNVIPRNASFDSHTLLSKGFFMVLDATEDWRTNQNPLVTGSPNIKFYLGVPLIANDKYPIGSLSIFDCHPQKKYPSENIKYLQNKANELMGILNSPIKYNADKSNNNINSNNNYANLSNVDQGLKKLKREIGRATSRGDFSIFEKDGSGGPYIQNYNLRFARYFENLSPQSSEDLTAVTRNIGQQSPTSSLITSQYVTQMLQEKLLNRLSFKNAALIVSKIIASIYSFDYVYLLEIRTSESFALKKEFFPMQEKKLIAETFKFSHKLIPLKNCNVTVLTRVIGSYGSKYTNFNYEDKFHKEALSSEFGIRYRNKRATALYNSGIVLPIFKGSATISKKHKCKINNDEIGVYLKCSGYLLSCFNEDSEVHIDDNKIASVMECGKVFRDIYLVV